MWIYLIKMYSFTRLKKSKAGLFYDHGRKVTKVAKKETKFD